jgi:predicted alpha/beta hydrolase family esterase
MSKTALIIHGKPSKESYSNSSLPSASNGIWLPWLQQQLLQRDISTQTPEMLRAYQPDYSIWSRTFEQFELNSDTVLVGHSCGGGFLVQWLSEHPEVNVGHVFLVAPAFGDTLVSDPADKYEQPLLNGFFDFTPDPGLESRVASLHLLYSDDDSIRVDKTIDLLKHTYPEIKQHVFSGYGHFTQQSGRMRSEFNELLDIIDEALGD